MLNLPAEYLLFFQYEVPNKLAKKGETVGSKLTNSLLSRVLLCMLRMDDKLSPEKLKLKSWTSRFGEYLQPVIPRTLSLSGFNQK